MTAELGLDDYAADQFAELELALDALRAQAPQLHRWGQHAAERLGSGGRILAAGNGGSAAEAQHLTAEFVGRFDRDRRPYSAIALHADTSALTAIGNDYGYELIYARQIEAHARPGDMVILLSTSGRSPNMLRAAAAARAVDASVWAMTGPAPNPLVDLADDAIVIPGCTARIQEAHLVAVHLFCAAFESARSDGNASTGSTPIGATCVLSS